MGIQGLLPLLKSIHQQVEPKDYRGQTVAIDAYCWLHKGVYACAYELGIGSESTVYVNYCMKRIKMLLYHNVKPIMVFDGRNLPTKADKEKERRESRAKAKKAAKEYLEKGNRQKATECFQRCIDITPDMARNVVKACYDLGVQCIVAPYEADAQLAYLQQAGVADMIISEDSDLLAYGCNKVLFKMDACGYGTLIDASHFGDVSAVDLNHFTIDDFRHMCILSGCDYLSSVTGVGLQTAAKLLKRFNKDVAKVISHLRLDCSKRVPVDYEKRFWLAEYTFLHQIVYDPETKQTRNLKAVSSDVRQLCDDWSFVGICNDPAKAAAIATGALSLSGDVIPGFDLSKPCTKPQRFGSYQPEVTSSISAMFPKASGRPASKSGTDTNANSRSTTKKAQSYQAQTLTHFRRGKQAVMEERSAEQAILMSYGSQPVRTAASSSFSIESPLQQEQEQEQRRRSLPALAPVHRRPASPLRNSLGEQVLTDEESSLPESYSDLDTEEPLAASFDRRAQSATPSSATKCTRISKFFAEAAIHSPSSKNTISTMLQESEHHRHEAATSCVNQYQPPVSPFGARPRPLLQSNSKLSSGGVKAEAEKERSSVGSGGLAKFSYANKRRSSDASGAVASSGEATEQLSVDERRPPLKMARRSSDGATEMEEQSGAMVTIEDDDDEAGASPIVSGNATGRFMSASTDIGTLSQLENIPPPTPPQPRLSGLTAVRPSPSRLPVTHRPSPGKKLLATLAKSRRSGGKRLGVGRQAMPTGKSDIRGFMPGCFDQFQRKPKPIAMITLEDDDGMDTADVESPTPIAAIT